tara:strand:+ start:195 stop:911 length:717 start_codon:yes stop_codon:yes gene_type:complete
MKYTLTVLQNFIITKERILNHLKSDVGLKCTASVLGECKWIVNYKTDLYLDEVKNLYDKYLDDYEFHNIIQDVNYTWATSTLSLLEKVDTPYVFYLTEDRMFHKTTREEFNEVMNEVIDNDIGFMCIGKLWRYGLKKFPTAVQEMGITDVPYMDNDKHIYTYLSKNSPYGCLSIDSIFSKKVLEKSLLRLIHSKDKRPHVLERGGNWLPSGMPEMLCAVPKNEIIVSDDDPGYELGGK